MMELNEVGKNKIACKKEEAFRPEARTNKGRDWRRRQDV